MEKNNFMELHIYKSADEVITGLADFFVQTVNSAIEANGECNLVLSGGNSPKKLYELLASVQYKNKVDWAKIWFFFGDERNIPFTNKDNNGLMVKQSLFDPLNIDEAKIFYINTTLTPDAAATDYAKKIIAHFGKNPIQFDLILLGLGNNAHTASLFPHTQVLYEMKALMSALFIEELKAFRITMTAPLINEAHQIAFLVYGASKATAVYQILKGEKNIDNYPAQLIEAEEGTVHWFLDEAAAVQIKDLA
jgi:6-phosphogluconolactonase